ncbi:MAG: fibronectin type III domain-containing protein, partial [candidate division KSB1 bacterium]
CNNFPVRMPGYTESFKDSIYFEITKEIGEKNVVRIDHTNPSNSLLLLMPAGQSTHSSGGIRTGWRVGEPEYNLTLQWIREGAYRFLAPTNLRATLSAGTQITLSWTDRTSGLASHRIQRKLAADNTFITVATRPPGAADFQDTGITAGTTYVYQVRAENSVGNSADSLVSITTLAAPSAPADFSATPLPSGRQINLAWRNTATNAIGIQIERQTGVGALVLLASVPPNSTQYPDASVAPGTTYTYRIYAVNNAGASSQIPSSPVTTPSLPGAPTSLKASTISDTVIELEWQSADAKADSFKIERKLGNADFVLRAAKPASGGLERYTDSGLQAGATYTYRVYAKNGVGDSPFSDERAATTSSKPSAPSNVIAFPAASGRRIDLQWTNTSPNADSIKLERKKGAADFLPLTSKPPNSVSHVDPSVEPSATYTYRLYAVNRFGNSDYAVTAPVTTPALPGPPGNLRRTELLSNRIALAWPAAAANVDSFYLERKIGNGVFNLLERMPKAVVTYSDSGLTPCAAYAYQLYAVNAVGRSAPSNTVSANTPLVSPQAPSNFIARVESRTQVLLAWNNAATAATHFRLERSAGNATTFGFLASLPSSSNNHRDEMNLQLGTTYFYRLRAENKCASDSLFSAFVPALEPARIPDANAPNAPTNLLAGAISNTAIIMIWEDNAVNETGYFIERKTGAGAFDSLTTLPANSSGYRDVGLTPNSTYIYRVSAVNSAGPSSPSNEATVTTFAVGVEEPSTAHSPTQFYLYQNTPNPFNPSTKLRYALIAKSAVRLFISNALGQRVRALVESEKVPGFYEVTWDGCDENGAAMPSGVYFCTLRTEQERQTRRLLLLK